jgi:membrane-bound lytic murein transglycosylase MltF
MIRVLIFLFFFTNITYASTQLESHIDDIEMNDLAQIIESRYIRVLTTKNSFDYYIYQGQHKGYQYELIKKFVAQLNRKFLKESPIKIQFEMIPVDYDKLIPMLNSGKGDLIAANLTITKSRADKISFSKPYLFSDELIIKNTNIKKISTVHIRKSSSYYESLKKSKYNYSITPESLDTVNLIELVSLGQYEATVSDTVYAKISKNIFENISILAKPLKSKQKIAWGVRYKSPKLLKEINLFIPKIKNGSFLGNMLKKRYFNDVSRTLSNQKKKRISRFDKLIKKYAKKYSWDWRLLTSLCFQESRFNQKIVNKWGAIGLFQIKQMTANEPYINIPNIKGSENVENNIHAGVKYLSWIKNRYFNKKSIKLKDQYRLTMAAYNAGPARVRKAIKLARKMKLNPNKWFRNVEYAMAKMRKMEPVTYISEINKRFVSYKILGF